MPTNTFFRTTKFLQELIDHTPSVLLMAAALVSSSAWGATLVQYTGGTSGTTFSMDATTVNEGLVAGAITNGGHLEIGDSTVNFPDMTGVIREVDGINVDVGSLVGDATPSAMLIYAKPNQTTVAAAVTAGDYLTITVAPKDGQIMSLDSLSYVGNITGGTSADSITLQINTGLGFVDVSTFVINLSAGTSPNPLAETTSVPYFDLSSWGSITTETTFRLVYWDTVGGAGSGAHRLDNLTLMGSVTSAVPEPSRLMLLSAGALALLLRRKRRPSEAG